MNTTINVDSDQCVGCTDCVRICPATVFKMSDDDKSEIRNLSACIICGHCVAVCPVSCIEHSDFPEGKVHNIKRDKMPSSEQLMELLTARRSNRTFTNKPIAQADLDKILAAAHRAPTASNNQQVKYTLITDPVKLKLLTELTINIYHTVFKKLNNPLVRPLIKRVMPETYAYLPRFKELLDEYRKGNDLILRGATAVLLIHTPASCRFGCEDSNLAYQNGSLMAESMGVSQFYTGFVCSATKQSKEINKAFNISGIIHAGMALGMSDLQFRRYIDKKDIDVTLV